MRIIEAEQAKYLIKSLQHHPSPYIIFDKSNGVEWLNNAAHYIFSLQDDESISINDIKNVKKDSNNTEVSEIRCIFFWGKVFILSKLHFDFYHSWSHAF